MLLYIIQVTFCWICFGILYQFLYQKETFFRLNRLYLLGSIVLGIVLPLNWAAFGLFPMQVDNQVTNTVYLSPLIVGTQQVNQQVQDWSFSYLKSLSVLYFIGVFFMSIRFGWGIIRLIRLYHNSTKSTYQNVMVAHTNAMHLPFSFLDCIYWGEVPNISVEAQAMMMQHEIAHIKQKHTWDILFLEIINTIFWCSPILYWYKNNLITIHEYLADEAVTKTNSKKTYGTILLQQAQSGITPAFVHHFHSQLKLRFAMLIRKKSSQWAYSKYALFIPLVFLLSLFFKDNTLKAQGNSVKKDDFFIFNQVDTLVIFDTETLQETMRIIPYQDTIYNNPDTPAEFKGGQAALFKFMAEHIKYPPEARAKNIAGKCILKFRVTKEGYVENIEVKKSTGSEMLDMAAINMANKMSPTITPTIKGSPYWNSGLKDGKPVATEFILPVVFKLDTTPTEKK